MNIDPIHVRIAEARAAEAALIAACSKLVVPPAIEEAADATLDRAYATAPTSVAGIAALARLAIDAEGETLEPAIRNVLESIERGALAMAGH